MGNLSLGQELAKKGHEVFVDARYDKDGQISVGSVH